MCASESESEFACACVCGYVSIYSKHPYFNNSLVLVLKTFLLPDMRRRKLNASLSANTISADDVFVSCTRDDLC